MNSAGVAICLNSSREYGNPVGLGEQKDAEAIVVPVRHNPMTDRPISSPDRSQLVSLIVCGFVQMHKSNSRQGVQ